MVVWNVKMKKKKAFKCFDSFVPYNGPYHYIATLEDIYRKLGSER